MDDALQSGLSQLRSLFPFPIPLELSDLISLFGAELAPRLRAAWAIECRLHHAKQESHSGRVQRLPVPSPRQVKRPSQSRDPHARTGRPTSTVAAENSAYAKQVARAFALLDRLKSCSRTARELADDPDAKAAFHGICERGPKARGSAQSLANAITKFSSFRDYAFARRSSPADINELLIAAWIVSRSLRAAGSSVPQSGHAALSWAVEVYRLPWNLDHASIRGAVVMPGSGNNLRDPKQAAAPTEDQLRDVERLLANADTPVKLWFEAGVVLFCTYSSKRFSCFQRLRSNSLQLTTDALRATSWKQKSKKGKRTIKELSFCACRKGIEHPDWAGLWMQARTEYAAAISWDCSAADFLVPVVVKATTRKPSFIGAATGSDCKRLLSRVFTAAGHPTANFFCQGLRAFMATAAAQMRISKESRELLGGWAPGSNMPDHYDRRVGTAELLVRSEIMDFFRDGGKLGEAFELPRKPRGNKRSASSSSSSSSDSDSDSSSSSSSS